MSKKYLNSYIFFFLISVNFLLSQNKLKLIAKYDYKGTELFTFDNNKYITFYFGGFQVGTWKMIDKNFVEFTPNVPKSDFEMFGRYNKSITDSISISFEKFEEREIFIQNGELSSTKNPVMKRVFNKNPNGFNYPYTHLFDKNKIPISFGIQVYNDNNNVKECKIYQYKIENNYNEFIAYYVKKGNDSEPFLIEIDNYDSNLNKFKNLKDNELKSISEILMNNENYPSPQDIVLYNAKHSMYENNGNIDIKNDLRKYKYDKVNDVYVGGFNSDEMKFIYPYYKIKGIELITKKISIDEKSIFDTNNDFHK